MALSDAAKEAVYITNFLQDLRCKNLTNCTVHCDNQGAMKLAINAVYHGRSKHIDIRHHFIRKVLEDKKITLKYLPTEEMTAEVIKKTLPMSAHTQELGILPQNTSRDAD